jgi:uncharacterized membrane protein YgcG
MAALAIGILIVTGAARAAGPGAESNPYRVIFQRSAFGLVSPPPAAEISANDFPPDIILNGIMVIFERKYALFKLPADKGKSYLLGEGQSDGEIELLSVDDRAGVIKINNHGVIQTIALVKPPALLSAPAAAAPGIAPAVAAGNNPQPVWTGDIPQPAMENNLAPVTAPFTPAGYAVVGAGNSGNSGSSQGGSQGGSSGGNTPSDGASGSQTSGGSSSTTKAAPEPWWVVASRNVEAARTATAGLVGSGQAEPFPLTPYTPPGTPANLIGPEQLYFVGAAN